MSMQSVFTKVATHLLTQRAKSVGRDKEGESLCQYRGEGGRSCAIGCLIPDELYNQVYEGRSVGAFFTTNCELIEKREAMRPVYSFLCKELDLDETKASKDVTTGITPKAVKMLEALQELHDDTPSVYWESGLQTIADIYELEMSETLS